MKIIRIEKQCVNNLTKVSKRLFEQFKKRNNEKEISKILLRFSLLLKVVMLIITIYLSFYLYNFSIWHYSFIMRCQYYY